MGARRKVALVPSRTGISPGHVFRALRAAKPFNNVPPGMLDQFGRATFEWAFVVTPEGSSTRWLGR